MEARRQSLTIVLSFALAFLLSACKEDDSALLKIELAKLRDQVHHQAGVRAAELAYLEEQASIALGCDWLIPMCPSIVVTPGRKAIEAGFGGGSTWPFWAAVLAKLAAAGAFSGALIGVSMWAAHRFARPEAAEVERARELLETAEKSAQEAAKRDTEAQTKWREMEHLIDQQKSDLATLQAKVDETKREIQALESAKNALRSFD